MKYIISYMAKKASRKKLLVGFGQLDKDDISFFSSDFSNAQKLILIEELLRLRYIENVEFELPVEYFKNIKIFGLEVKVIFSASAASFAVVPLDNSDNNAAPEYIHLWLFKDIPQKISDHSHLLKGSNILNKSIKMFIFHSTDENDKGQVKEIVGISWQLAGKLAEKALLENKQNLKKALAKDWVITGTCDGENVSKVKLGNKLDLSFKNKRWLMPRSNRDDITPQYEKKLAISFTASFNDAVSHITREATKKMESRQWPKRIDELHILVGKSIKAPFMPLLLTSPRKVLLWHSSESKVEASILEKIINKLYPKITIEVGAELSSNNIQHTEQIFLDHFIGREELKIIFNITSGNRIMGFSAQTIARLYPNVELVYRDFDNKVIGEFIHLSYTEFPPYSGTLTTTKKIVNNYNWSFLNKNDRDAPYFGHLDFINKLNKIGV